MSQATDSAGLLGSAAGYASGFSGVGGLLGLAGTLAGIFGGGSDSGKDPAQQAYQQMAQILNAGLNKALNFNTNYTNQAINQQNTSLQQAINALTGYGQQAQQVATNAINQGLSQYQQLQKPYANAGYDALDAYKQSLGLATPQGGTRNQVLASQLQPLLQSLKGNYNTPTAPDMTTFANQITQDQIKDYINNNIHNKASYTQDGGITGVTDTYSGVGSSPNSNVSQGLVGQGAQANLNDPNLRNTLMNSLLNNPSILSQVRNSLAQPAYQAAQGQYNQNMGTLNQINTMLQGADVSKLAPFLRGSL